MESEEGIRGEFHCHNCYSNYQEPSTRFPLDSPQQPLEQLRAAAKNGLDFIFITNHNTTAGYMELIKCQKEHTELKKVKVYCGEEMSAFLREGLYGHVLGWGLNEEVKRGQTVGETVDEIRSQGAVSCAAHPFGLTFAVREKAVLCDLIEIFNSNNIDTYSNMRACESAKKWKKFGMAGSDAHLADEMGNTIVRVRSENNLDSILHAVMRGRFDVEKSTYATLRQLTKHVQFSLSDTSRLLPSIRESYGAALEDVVKLVMDRFKSNPGELWAKFLTKVFIASIRNISLRANICGSEWYASNTKFIDRFVRSFIPVRKSAEASIFSKLKPSDLIAMLNGLNRETGAGFSSTAVTMI